MQIYSILDFGLGINNRYEPYYNAPGASRQHNNADTDSKALRASKGTSVVLPFVGNYPYKDWSINANAIVSYNEPTRFIYHSSDSYAAPLSGGRVVKNLLFDLQIPAPTGINAFAVSPETGATGGGGTLQYAITFYNRSSGIESAPLESAVISDTSNWITSSVSLFIDPPDTDTITLDIRLYRRGTINGETNTDYLRVDSIDYSDYVAHTNNYLGGEYIDSIASSILYGTLDTKNLMTTRLEHVVYIAASLSTLYLVEKDSAKVWFSTGDLWHIDSTNFLVMPTTIVGIATIANNLLVMCIDGSSYIVRGSSVLDISKHLLSGDASCIAHTTITKVVDTLVWLGNDGLYASRGNMFTPITKKIIDKDYFSEDSEDSHWEAVSYRDKYYLAYYPNNILYEYDIVLGKLVTYDLQGAVTIYSDIHGLYGYDSINQNIVKFFDGPLLPYTWESGSTSKPDITVLKEFYSVHMFYKGECTINIYVDGGLVNTVTMSSNTLIGDTFLLNSEQSIGYSCNFTILGTADVHTVRIMYKEVEDSRFKVIT